LDQTVAPEIRQNQAMVPEFRQHKALMPEIRQNQTLSCVWFDNCLFLTFPRPDIGKLGCCSVRTTTTAPASTSPAPTGVPADLTTLASVPTNVPTASSITTTSPMTTQEPTGAPTASLTSTAPRSMISLRHRESLFTLPHEYLHGCYLAQRSRSYQAASRKRILAEEAIKKLGSFDLSLWTLDRWQRTR